MEPVLWKDEFCIGIEEIDKQHMDFVKLINRFMVLFYSGGHISLQDRLLLEILRYAEYHFVSEENIMMFYNYPDIATQKEAHSVLVRSLKSKSSGLKEGSVNGNDLIRFLINWFMHHTQEEDRKIARYILNRGIDGEKSAELYLIRMKSCVFRGFLDSGFRRNHPCKELSPR